MSGPKCFAIPTKDYNIETLPLEVIGKYVAAFLRYAVAHPEKHFLVTAIGTGLAGLTTQSIAPLFFAHPIPANVSLPSSFWKERKP